MYKNRSPLSVTHNYSKAPIEQSVFKSTIKGENSDFKELTECKDIFEREEEPTCE